jgi:hypothetical protein
MCLTVIVISDNPTVSHRGLMTQGCYLAQEMPVPKVELKEEDIQ